MRRGYVFLAWGCAVFAAAAIWRRDMTDACFWAIAGYGNAILAKL